MRDPESFQGFKSPSVYTRNEKGEKGRERFVKQTVRRSCSRKYIMARALGRDLNASSHHSNRRRCNLMVKILVCQVKNRGFNSRHFRLATCDCRIHDSGVGSGTTRYHLSKAIQSPQPLMSRKGVAKRLPSGHVLMR